MKTLQLTHHQWQEIHLMKFNLKLESTRERNTQLFSVAVSKLSLESRSSLRDVLNST